MTDKETLSVYAESAARYAERFAATDDGGQSEDITVFTASIPNGGRVLDLGCGPGQWAAVLRDRGFIVDARDASPEMAELAAKQFGLDVQIATFDDLDAERLYDGVWANFSLLHAPRSAFPGHLQSIHRALKDGGAFLIGMKLGKGEKRDHLGRFYTFYSEAGLKDHLRDAGFTVEYVRRGHATGLAGTDDPFAVMIARG